MHTHTGATDLHNSTTLRPCSIGINRFSLVWLVEFFLCSIGRKLFLVGLVDQLFQPAQSLVETVETVENDG